MGGRAYPRGGSIRKAAAALQTEDGAASGEQKFERNGGSAEFPLPE